MKTHQKQWQFLKKTVELGKIPHALLFYGQDLVGEKKMAIEFIKLLNCEAKTGEKPCSQCRACHDIEKEVHPDFFLIKPLPEEKEIKISQIRNLNNSLSLKSYSAPYKAIVVEQAHCLNTEAQSAFLKLLEEPKGNTIFILISRYPEMLLATILSRVERLRFYESSSKNKKTEDQKKAIAEIIKVSQQALAERFNYAKEVSESNSDLKEVLDVWLNYFREDLLTAVNDNSKDLSKLKKILKTIQATDFLISTTNVSPRLAFEMIMLEL
ncbi:MAG: DNA polymerase III subunit [Candidatus Nealsonbacteria bacterium]